MQEILDALWRALADCFRPRVLLWSLLPLVLIGVMAGALGWFWWADASLWMRGLLRGVGWLGGFWEWLGPTYLGILAALLLVLLVSPVLVILALLVASVSMTPQMVALVAARRFPDLERRQGAGWWQSLGWALMATLVAVLALLITLPLWLIPPLILLLPPLIWGWLTYRVLAFDALSAHASTLERRELMRQHRYRLLLIGVVCGFAGAAPSLLWASGLILVAAFWLLIPLAIWLYALIMAFSSLWFAHYCLSALADRRATGPV